MYHDVQDKSRVFPSIYCIYIYIYSVSMGFQMILVEVSDMTPCTDIIWKLRTCCASMKENRSSKKKSGLIYKFYIDFY